MRIILIQYRNTPGLEMIQDFTLSLNDAGQTAKTLNMRCARHGDQSDIRAGRLRAKINFSLAIGTHFNDGVAMLFLQPQQSQRHADGVVQIGLCPQRWRRFRKNARNQFFDCCFGLTPCQSDYFGSASFAIQPGYISQCVMRVIHN